ncbi:hypothetical protein CHS0354_012717 [Potamilus streckersoni]|uniref:Uncharacterized protein n=1 Tax=Potamilus streckersoni TaxID=2493646 RepID=A0AAE0SXR1_9BIVA|nr:hypothetical protein CHS0354_012717 [Potamilus streckersoni]
MSKRVNSCLISGRTRPMMANMDPDCLTRNRISYSSLAFIIQFCFVNYYGCATKHKLLFTPEERETKPEVTKSISGGILPSSSGHEG